MSRKDPRARIVFLEYNVIRKFRINFDFFTSRTSKIILVLSDTLSHCQIDVERDKRSWINIFPLKILRNEIGGRKCAQL